MSDKIDSTSWTADYPNRDNAPFTVKNGKTVVRIVLVAVAVVFVVSGLLIAGGLI